MPTVVSLDIVANGALTSLSIRQGSKSVISRIKIQIV